MHFLLCLLFCKAVQCKLKLTDLQLASISKVWRREGCFSIRFQDFLRVESWPCFLLLELGFGTFGLYAGFVGPKRGFH